MKFEKEGHLSLTVRMVCDCSGAHPGMTTQCYHHSNICIFLFRKVYVVFGLKPQDRSDCHVSDALCSGDTVWDENFYMNSPRVQQSFMVNTNRVSNQSISFEIIISKRVCSCNWLHSGNVPRFKLCLHVTSASAFVSNVMNRFYSNKWWCLHLTFAFSRMWPHRSKENANADVTCKPGFSNKTLFFVCSQFSSTWKLESRSWHNFNILLI